MTTFLPELVEIIVHDIWNSEMLSFVRKSFMTTCPGLIEPGKLSTPLSLLRICTSPTSHFWTIYAIYPGPEDLSSTMTLSPGLLVPLPASSTSEKIAGKAQQKGFIVISLSYLIFVVSKLCSNLFIIYLSRSFGGVFPGRCFHRYSHHSVVFPFESLATGSCRMPPRTTIEATLGRHECVYIFP